CSRRWRRARPSSRPRGRWPGWTSDPASTPSSPTTPPGSPTRRSRCSAIRRALARSRAPRARSSSGGIAGPIPPPASRRHGSRPRASLERAPPSAMSPAVYRRDGGWRLRWAILVAGDLLAACLAYLLAFMLRVAVPFPLTQGFLPPLRFAEVHHHWPEMLAAQGAVLYFLGCYEVHALTR